MKFTSIPIDEMRECFSYDPDTGEFTHLVAYGKRKAGDRADVIHHWGYAKVTFRARQYVAHRVAWAFVNNMQPPEEIDHINSIRHDNRICNLRSVTRLQNNANTPAKAGSISGYKGVLFDNTSGVRPWKACIRINGKQTHIGRFATAEEAGLVYEIVAEQVHGQYAVHKREAA